MYRTALLPYHLRPGKADTISIRDLTGKAFFHVHAQCRIAGQLPGARATAGAVSVPLCGDRAIFQIAATRGGIAPHFARDSTG